jgi:hypothetical protein
MQNKIIQFIKFYLLGDIFINTLIIFGLLFKLGFIKQIGELYAKSGYIGYFVLIANIIIDYLLLKYIQDKQKLNKNYDKYYQIISIILLVGIINMIVLTNLKI